MDNILLSIYLEFLNLLVLCNNGGPFCPLCLVHVTAIPLTPPAPSRCILPSSEPTFHFVTYSWVLFFPLTTGREGAGIGYSTCWVILFCCYFCCISSSKALSPATALRFLVSCFSHWNVQFIVVHWQKVLKAGVVEAHHANLGCGT